MTWAASKSSPDRRSDLLLAFAGLFVLLLGGRLDVFYLDPDLAWLSLALLTAAALWGWRGLWLAAETPSLAPLLAWLLWGALAAAAAIYPRAAWETCLWQLVGAGLWLAGWRLGRRPGEVGRVTDALAPALAALVLLGLAEAAGWMGPPVHYTEAFQRRLVISLNHPNNLCGLIALTTPLMLARALGRRRDGRRALAAGFGLLTLGLLWCAAHTYSRGGEMALALGLAGLGLLAAPRRAWVPAVAVTVLAAALLLSPFGARLRHAGRSAGGDERLGTWRAAERMIGQHPVTGVGPGCFWLAFPGAKAPGDHHELFTHAHQWYLHTAAEGGLPLAAALIGLLASGVGQALGAARRAADGDQRLAWAGLAAGLLAFAAAGLTDVNVGVPAIAMIFWLLLGLAAAGAEPRPRRGAKPLAAVAAAAMVALFGWWSVCNRGHAAYMNCCRLLATGHWAPAAAELERARQLDPGQRCYDLVRAELALAGGRRDLARSILERHAADRAPLDPNYLALLLDLRGGDGAEDLPRVDPADAMARVEAGRLTTGAAAETQWRAAAKMDPDATGAAAALAQAAWTRGDAAEARRWLELGAAAVKPRDRMPRFLPGYGRPDPLAMLPVRQRGRWPGTRPDLDGLVLPPLGFALNELWLDSIAAPSPRQ